MVKNLSRNQMKKEMNDVILQLKNNSKDSKFAESLIDKLMSLKGQIDIEPMRIHIKESDVVKEYDFESVRFIRCKGCIIFESKGGSYRVTTPRMNAEYKHLENLLDLKDAYNDLSDDMKKAYENIFTATMYVFNLPIYATCDDEFFFGIATDIIKRTQTLVDKMSKQELKEETREENAEFENKMEVLENSTEGKE